MTPQLAITGNVAVVPSCYCLRFPWPASTTLFTHVMEKLPSFSIYLPRGTVFRHTHMWPSSNIGPRQTWHLGLAPTSDTADQGFKASPL